MERLSLFSQINQIVMNLGTNGAHAMERAKGVLSITLETCRIDAAAAEAINVEAQSKMVAAVKSAGLSKEEYQGIATQLRNDPALLQRVNDILQKAAGQ